MEMGNEDCVEDISVYGCGKSKIVKMTRHPVFKVKQFTVKDQGKGVLVLALFLIWF